nr:hypothetical protein [Tanacetum cinerariifolium]
MSIHVAAIGFILFQSVAEIKTAEDSRLRALANCNLSTRLEKISEDLACLLFDIIFNTLKTTTSLSNNEESDFDNSSVPRPLPKPPDADFEPDSAEEISVVMNTIDELEFLDPRDEFDDDYSSFMFVIYSKVFSFLLFAESEDTIFDPGISI